MIKKRVNKINWHGSDLENNRAKAPNISTPGGNGLDGLNDGEIYVCNADEDPAIFIKTNKDKVARVGGNGSDSYSRDQIDDFLGKKLDKVVWDRNLEERVDDNGKEYLFLTKPLITAYGVTMYAGADVQVPSIYEGLPIDGVTIQWVDGKLVATGGKGTANGIVVNGNTYTPNEDGIITLPNYPTSLEWGNISGKPSWIGSTKPSYSWDEIGGKPSVFPTNWENVSDKPSWIGATKPTYNFSEIQNKPTTLAGYGITDAYTKNDISGLLADYVTKSGAQDITGIKSFINGFNIGDILVKKHSDGVVELDGDLILTGSLTMFAQGSHTASTILDALPTDETTLSKEGGVLSVIGGVGGGSVDGIILNGTTYSPDETTKLITLPNYPTTLPASDVYSWAKQPNKPSYSFGELSSHPTTLEGYGITDAYTQSDADGRFFRYFGYTTDDGDDFMWQKLGTFTYLNAFPDGVTIKRHGYGQVTSFIAGSSRFQLYSTHSSSDPNDGPNGIQFRSGWDDDKKSWRMLLDEVNYLHYTDNRYVNKAGDTMTGKLLFNANSGIDLVSIPRTKSAISFNNAGANRIGINFTDGDGNLRIARTDINQDWVSGDVNILLGSNNYKVWHAGNDGSGSGLDADLLDGKHLGNVGDRVMRQIGFPNHNEFGSTDTNVYLRKILGWCYNNVNTGADDSLFIGVGRPNSLGNMQIQVYCNSGINEEGYPKYSTGMYFPLTGNPTMFGTNDFNYIQRNLAFVDDNVESANRLYTPRTIFGKSFDGTGNVTGGAKFLNICIETDNNGNDSGRVSEINNYNSELNLQYSTSRDITMCFGGGNVRIGTGLSGYKLSVNGNVGIDGSITFQYLSGGNERNLLYQQMADNDLFRIRCGGPSNQGWVEIATADDGTEPIYVRQYTGEFASITRTLTLLDGSGNTICPGNLLTYGGITMYSDLRKKNVLNSIIVPLDVMANADLFDYTFKTDEKGKVRAGTSAQYWNVFLPQVTDTDNEGFFTMSYDVLATTCVLSMAKHFQRFLIEDFGRHETEIERLKRENEELKNRVSELERRAA
jgi:hypothetical protein|nr:MAG TPA: Receptor recognition protein, Long tail, Helical sandwich, Tail fiber [Caudoviricetes sp.]